MKENRTLLGYILLFIITFGIYGLYFIYAAARDVNEICKEDDRETIGLLFFVILTIITGGIFSFIWFFMIMERMNRYLEKHKADIRMSGLEFILWDTVGTIILIGPLIALYGMIHTLNDISKIYNR